MTTDEVLALLVQMLTGVVGGDPDRWARLIGPVEKRPSVENIHSNWRAAPIAEGEDLRAIELAIEHVRQEQPYVL